jgi:hypothetical protein
VTARGCSDKAARTAVHEQAEDRSRPPRCGRGRPGRRPARAGRGWPPSRGGGALGGRRQLGGRRRGGREGGGAVGETARWA